MGLILEYDNAYHLHCAITLHSGRSIILEELLQKQTYAGLLEGIPFASFNDQRMKWALETGRTKCINESEPLLIAPDRRDYLREPGDMEHFRSYKGGRPEWLPMVQCIGGFKSISPAHNYNMDGSHLVVVWFQNEFAPPISNGALEKMKSIDWESSATDYEY
jgi:hypothetical protein